MNQPLSVDRDSSIPIGDQLQAQIRVLIDMSVWSSGRQLPTIKELAAALKINYNTVAAAYRALEAEGYLVQRGRGGTSVAETPPKEQLLATYLAAQLAERVLASGLEAEGVTQLLFAHVALRTSPSRLRVAVVSQSPLAAGELAKRAQVFLGDGFDCIPLMPDGLNSSDYHFILIDPELTTWLTPSRETVPDDWQPYLTVPAGAD